MGTTNRTVLFQKKQIELYAVFCNTSDTVVIDRHVFFVEDDLLGFIRVPSVGPSTMTTPWSYAREWFRSISELPSHRPYSNNTMCLHFKFSIYNFSFIPHEQHLYPPIYIIDLPLCTVPPFQFSMLPSAINERTHLVKTRKQNSQLDIQKISKKNCNENQHVSNKKMQRPACIR